MTWTVCFYSFFFSSSIYMWLVFKGPLKSLWRYEVSRTDSIEKEMIYPPNERDEVLAAESETPLDFHRILQCLGGFGGKGLEDPVSTHHRALGHV